VEQSLSTTVLGGQVVRMPFELDHVFLAVSKGGQEVEEFLEAGFAEGPPNTHPGQGTACRRIFFENGYVELIWLEEPAEAASPLIAPTGLACRTGGKEGASRIGICLRPQDGTALVLPVGTWAYAPPYLPEGVAIPMALNSSTEQEPLLFFLPRTLRHRPPEPGHGNGAKKITNVGVTVCLAEPPSPELEWLAGSGCVRVEFGRQESLFIEFDHGSGGRRLELQTPTPLVLNW
jgi:hypothetical protein